MLASIQALIVLLSNNAAVYPREVNANFNWHPDLGWCLVQDFYHGTPNLESRRRMIQYLNYFHYMVQYGFKTTLRLLHYNLKGKGSFSS